MSAARIEMCAGEAGAGSSSLMTCPRKKGAVSKFQCCLAVACVMAQGGLKATITVVGPFEKGTVDRCLTRLKHHLIIDLFSGSYPLQDDLSATQPETTKALHSRSSTYNLQDAFLFSGHHLTSPKSLLANNPFHYTME